MLAAAIEFAVSAAHVIVKSPAVTHSPALLTAVFRDSKVA